MKTLELYYSDLCPDCHQLRKMLVENLPRDVKFKEVNISYSEGEKRARELGILSVPAIVIDGELRIVGRTDMEEILEELEK